MFICEKCHDMFRKQHRLDEHLKKCKGKVCKNCGNIGHLACGISISGKELKEKIKKIQNEGNSVSIVGLF